MARNTKVLREYIEDHTITDVEIIRKALSFGNDVPAAFLPKKLEPVGIIVFDSDDEIIKTNFKVGETYPIYSSENGDIIISGVTGVGMKIQPSLWNTRYF